MAARLFRPNPTWTNAITLARSTRITGFLQPMSTDTPACTAEDKPKKSASQSKPQPKPTKPKKPSPKKLVPPKRPMNIMQLITKDVMEEFKAENGSLGAEDARQCFRVAADRYRSLSDADKKNYVAELDRRREKYEIEMRVFLDSLTPNDYVNQQEYIRRRKAQGRSGIRKGIPKLDPNAPKRPMNAFMIFCSELRANPSQIPILAEQLKAAETDGVLSLSEASKIFAKYWRLMDEDLKQKYMVEAQKRSDLYKQEKAEYEYNNRVAPLIVAESQ